MYLDNKYTHWYYNIINASKSRHIPPKYTEKHHIIPKSLGGNNDQENLVKLTAKEHFVVHHLLIKMLSGKDKSKMVNAYWIMCNKKNGIVVNSRQYNNVE